MNTDTIVADVSDDDQGDFDAESAFLKTFEEKPEAEPGDAESPVPSDSSPDEAQPEDVETPPVPSDPADDDPEFDVVVGEETRKAKLSDLKRLYGQEAALTQKSQAVAQLRATAEANSAKAASYYTAAMERAQTAWEPYSKLDFLALSTAMDPADFAQLRAEAKAAHENFQFVSQGVDQIQQETAKRNAENFRERAAATIAELSDPEKGIKGWSPEVYNEVMSYAVSQGMPQQSAYAIAESSALRLVHKAMLYDRAQAKATAEVKKVVHKPTKVLRPGNGSADEPSDAKAALRSQRDRGGDHESTMDAFLAMSRG